MTKENHTPEEHLLRNIQHMEKRSVFNEGKEKPIHRTEDRKNPFTHNKDSK